MTSPRTRSGHRASSRATSRARARRRGGRAERDELLPALVTVLLAGPAVGMGGYLVLVRGLDQSPALWAAGITWALGLVIVGAVMPSPVAAGAGGALAAALAAVGHHLAGTWFDGVALDTELLERGVVAATVFGPILGMSGFWLTHRTDRSRPLAVAIVTGAVLVGVLAVIDAVSGG